MVEGWKHRCKLIPNGRVIKFCLHPSFGIERGKLHIHHGIYQQRIVIRGHFDVIIGKSKHHAPAFFLFKQNRPAGSQVLAVKGHALFSLKPRSISPRSMRTFTGTTSFIFWRWYWRAQNRETHEGRKCPIRSKSDRFRGNALRFRLEIPQSHPPRYRNGASAF